MSSSRVISKPPSCHDNFVFTPNIILPSLVIGALLVGNIILIYIIYLQKKKLAQKEEHIKLQPITKGEVNNENI
ncbi:hypothetical protein RUM43_009186 [Polyplax serrata]|uniref:Uncharacterized protein n=1 Tax=Polyplax serrata TaxID=468196 RepID=A0AAN8P7J6_POLSC